MGGAIFIGPLKSVHFAGRFADTVLRNVCFASSALLINPLY